jgi:hypothetical protein
MHYTDTNIQGYEGLVTLVKPSIFKFILSMICKNPKHKQRQG